MHVKPICRLCLSPLVLSVSHIQLQADECHLSPSFTSLTQPFNPLFSPLCPSFTLLLTDILPACLCSFFVGHQAVLPSSWPPVFHFRSLYHFHPSPSWCNAVPSLWLIYSIIIVFRVICYLFLLFTSQALLCTISSFIPARTLTFFNPINSRMNLHNTRRNQKQHYIKIWMTDLYLTAHTPTTIKTNAKLHRCLQAGYHVYLYRTKHAWSTTIKGSVVLQQHRMILIQHNIWIISFAWIINLLLQMVPVLS